MNANSSNMQNNKSQQSTNQNIQVFVRVRPLNEREKCMRSNEVVSVESAREIVTRHALEAKLTKKFTFDRTFGPESRQVDVYSATVAPLIEEVLAGYNCTVFAYGQTGTGKTHTMVGNELVTLSSAWDDNSDIGIIPRALCHLFDELRMMEVQYSMRVSYLELYNEQLCDLLSTDDNSAKIRIFDDSTKKGSVIINGLEEVTVHNKHDVYKLLEKGQERRKTAKTLMNAQSSRSHTVFSILVHMRETDILSNDEMVKIGKLNLVDLAGSENVSKAGNEKPIRVRETVNINQSLLTLGRVITALVERTPHIPYRESKLTRLLQESLGGRTKTAIIATVSPGHKDIEETLSTLEYAHRAKNIQNKPELNQKISQRAVLNQYTEEIDKLKRDLMAVREKNGIYLADETYYEMTTKMDSQCRELNEKALLLKALKDELAKKEKTFNEISLKLIDETTAHRDTQIDLKRTENNLQQVKQSLQITKLRYKEKKMLLNEHVKTEEELISQATEILEVADVATEDTVKLHSTIERRKSVDEKIATAGERLISHVNDNFKQMDTHIFTAHKHNNKLLEMTLDELRCGTEYLEELHKKTHDKNLHIKNNFSTQMQEIMKMLSASHQEMCSMNEADNQKDNIKFKSILQKTQNFVKELLTDFELWQSSSKAEKQALKELQTIAEALKQQRTTANAEHVAKLQQEVESMRAALKESNQAINTLQEQLKKEKQLQSQSKHELVEFQQKLQQQMQTQMNNYVQQMFDNMASQLSVSENKASDLLKANQQHEKLLGNCVDLSIAYGQQQEQHEKNALKNTLEYIEKRHACVQQQEVKQAELCKEIEVYEVEHKIELEEICSEHEAHKKLLVNHAENLLKSQEEKLCSVSADLSEAHDNLQTLVFENCQSIHEKHTLCGSLLCSLQTDVWDKLNGQYAELRNNCVKNITEIKQTELKTYQPTGMTPSKRDFQYPRTLKCTSPHDKLIKRFRLQHNDSEMDLSQITILEDSDGETLEDTQVIMPEMKIKQLNSTPLPEKNVENSSINSVLSSFENVESSIPLSLSRKRNNSTLVVKADNSNDKENDTL